MGLQVQTADGRPQQDRLQKTGKISVGTTGQNGRGTSGGTVNWVLNFEFWVLNCCGFAAIRNFSILNFEHELFFLNTNYIFLNTRFLNTNLTNNTNIFSTRISQISRIYNSPWAIARSADSCDSWDSCSKKISCSKCRRQNPGDPGDPCAKNIFVRFVRFVFKNIIGVLKIYSWDSCYSCSKNIIRVQKQSSFSCSDDVVMMFIV